MSSPLKRRNFLRLSGGVFLSAVGSVLLPGVATGCRTPAVLTASGEKEDEKKLQALLSDRSTPIRWLFTGDSITQGARHTYGYRSYPEIASERIRFELNRSRDLILNSAISGNATPDILQDLQWRVGQFHPHIVSLMIGTNDAAAGRKISVETFAANVRTLVQQFRAMGAIPILHTPNTINREGGSSAQQRADLPSYVEAIRSVAREQKVILVDHWMHWEANKEKAAEEGWLADPLHPGGRGHLEMARLFFRRLSIWDERAFTCTGNILFNPINSHVQ